MSERKNKDNRRETENQTRNVLTQRINLSTVAVNPNNLLKRDGSVTGDSVPGLAGAHVEVVQAVQVVVLNVPREPAEEHGDVDHGRSNARNLLLHEAQERTRGPRNRSHVPRSVRKGGGIPSMAAFGGERRTRHVVRVFHGEGFVQSGLPEERLGLKRGRTRAWARARALSGVAFEVRFLEGLGFGLELCEGVVIAALPYRTLHGTGAAGAEADLLLARGECGT